MAISYGYTKAVTKLFPHEGAGYDRVGHGYVWSQGRPKSKPLSCVVYIESLSIFTESYENDHPYNLRKRTGP